MASPMAAARTEDDAKRLFDERVNWQMGQFPRSALAEVEVRGLNSRRKQEPGTETLFAGCPGRAVLQRERQCCVAACHSAPSVQRTQTEGALKRA